MVISFLIGEVTMDANSKRDCSAGPESREIIKYRAVMLRGDLLPAVNPRGKPSEKRPPRIRPHGPERPPVVPPKPDDPPVHPPDPEDPPVDRPIRTNRQLSRQSRRRPYVRRIDSRRPWRARETPGVCDRAGDDIHHSESRLEQADSDPITPGA
jgi:hypothetical protein